MPSVSAVESLVSGALKSTLKAAQRSYSFLNKKQLSRKEKKKEKKLQRKLQRQFGFRNSSQPQEHHQKQNHHHQQESTSAGCSSLSINSTSSASSSPSFVTRSDTFLGNQHIRKFKSKHQKQQNLQFQLNKSGKQQKGSLFKGGKKFKNSNKNNNSSCNFVDGKTHKNSNNNSTPGKFVKVIPNNDNSHKKYKKFNSNGNNILFKSSLPNSFGKNIKNNKNKELLRPTQQQLNNRNKSGDSSNSSSSSGDEEEEEAEEEERVTLKDEDDDKDSSSDIEDYNFDSEALEFTTAGPQVSPFTLSIRSKYLCLNKCSSNSNKKEKNTPAPSSTSSVNGHIKESSSSASSTSHTAASNKVNKTETLKKNKNNIQNELPASSGLKGKASASTARMNGTSNINGGITPQHNNNGNISVPPPPRLAEPKHVLYKRESIQPGWTIPSMPVGSGLINLGNSCYLNATLQALLHTPSFVNWLLSDKDHEKKCRNNSQLVHQCTICAMTRTLMEAYRPNCQPIRPMQIYNKLKVICKHFQHGRQEDAHEFLRYLLESMERSYLVACNGQKLDNRSKETTPLSQIFGGYIRTEVTCLKCQHVSTTFQPLAELQLDIRHVSTLEDAIQNHFKKERLDYNDYKCEKCHTSSPATKQFSLEIPPIVLCLQLKRFTLYGTKINKPIHCNRALNLSSYINKAIKETSNVEAHYRLVGLVTHIGSSPNCGHYTAIAAAPNGQFYQFDDSYVRQCSFNAAQNSDAYVIIYEIDRSKTNNHHNTSRPTSTATSNSFIKQPQQQIVKNSSNLHFNPSKSPTNSSNSNHFISSSSTIVPPRSPPKSTSTSPRPEMKNGINGVDVRFSNNNNIKSSNSYNSNSINHKNHSISSSSNSSSGGGGNKDIIPSSRHQSDAVSNQHQPKTKTMIGPQKPEHTDTLQKQQQPSKFTSNGGTLLNKETHKNIIININNNKNTSAPSTITRPPASDSSSSKLVNGDATKSISATSSVRSPPQSNYNKLTNGNVGSGVQFKSKIPNENNKTATSTSPTSPTVPLKRKLTLNNNNNNTSEKAEFFENKFKKVKPSDVGVAKLKVKNSSSGSLKLVPYDDEDEKVTTTNGSNGSSSPHVGKSDANLSREKTTTPTSIIFQKKNNTSKLVRPLTSTSTFTSASSFVPSWKQDYNNRSIKTWNGSPSNLESCIIAERKRGLEKTKEELEDEEIDSGRIKKRPKADGCNDSKPLVSFDTVAMARAASRNHVM